MRKPAIGMFVCLLALLEAAAPAATGSFKIGFLYPQKDSSWVVESFSQFRLAVKRINEAPPRSSFPILEFVAYDSRGNSLTALKGANKLIETDRCDVLIGPAYSAEVPAASAFASVCARTSNCRSFIL
jgi:ABC-type branched-subunit amino acid transport system substrate-binding protein